MYLKDVLPTRADTYAGFPEYRDMFEDKSDNLPTVMEEESLMPKIEERTNKEHDKQIGAEVLIEVGGEKKHTVVKSRACNADRNPIENKNDNYILDTREYKVQFKDGATNIYGSNIIMENIYSQVDEEGNMFVLMDEIVDHKKELSALSKSKGTHTTKMGAICKKITTKGWELKVEWKDRTSNWVKLSDLKKSFPIEVAEYARDNKLLEEPAFAWWAPFTLRCQSHLICKSKTKYWLKTHKYGVRLLKTIKEVLQIDKEISARH